MSTSDAPPRIAAGLAGGFTLVIPAHNEELHIAAVVREAHRLFADCGPYEILIGNDGSTDKTAEILAECARQDPRVHVLTHRERAGIQATFEDLYRAARTEWIASFAGNGKWRLEDVRAMLTLRGSYDVIIGKRKKKYRQLFRNLTSEMFRWLVRLFFGVDTLDPGSIKVFKSEMMTRFPIRSASVFGEAERLILARRAGYRLGSVDVSYEDQARKRAWSVNNEILVCLADLLRLRWSLWVDRRRGL